MNDNITPSPRSAKRLTIAGLVTLGLVSGGAVAASAAAASGGSSSGSGSSTTPPAPAPGGPRGAVPSAYDTDGTVTAVSSSSLTVRDAFGSARTYAIGSSTTVHSGPTRSKASALTSGEHVHVHASKSSGTLKALDVDVRQAHLGGTVTAVNGATITVSDPDGFTRQIDVSSATTYTKDGAKAGLSAVRDGVVVQAAGSVDSDTTSLDAETVAVYTSAAALPAGPHGGPAARAGKGGPAGKLRPLGKAAPTASPAAGSGATKRGDSAPSANPAAPSGVPSAPSGAGSAPSTGSTAHGS